MLRLLPGALLLLAWGCDDERATDPGPMPQPGDPVPVEVAQGLGFITDIQAAPGDPARLYVANRAGLIRVVHEGAVRSTPFLDISAHVRSGGEQGLLGFTFAPDFADRLSVL